MEKRCEVCQCIILENYDKWLEDNPEAVYIQCPICFHLEKIR